MLELRGLGGGEVDDAELLAQVLLLLLQLRVLLLRLLESPLELGRARIGLARGAALPRDRLLGFDLGGLEHIAELAHLASQLVGLRLPLREGSAHDRRLLLEPLHLPAAAGDLPYGVRIFPAQLGDLRPRLSLCGARLSLGCQCSLFGQRQAAQLTL